MTSYTGYKRTNYKSTCKNEQVPTIHNVPNVPFYFGCNKFCIAAFPLSFS